MDMQDVTNNENSTKKGRPTVDPEWPQGQFTFKSLSDSNKGNLCDSSLRNKVKKALKEGEIKKVSTHRGDVGRPQDVYLSSSKMAVSNQSPSCDSSQQPQSCQTQPSQSCQTQLDQVGQDTRLS